MTVYHTAAPRPRIRPRVSVSSTNCCNRKTATKPSLGAPAELAFEAAPISFAAAFDDEGSTHEIAGKENE
eukprot:2226627-Amphidinium_carterae.1